MMMEIRECQPGDFGEVVRLLGQLWPGKPLDTASLQAVFNRAMASESQVYLCATEARRIVGFGSLTLKNNLWQAGYLGHVDELIVDSEFRGRGIGTELLRQLVMIAGKRHCQRIELDSAFHRKEAHAFYQRQGFDSRALLFSKVI